MKPENFGVNVTVLEWLAYLVPGTIFIWVLLQIEAEMVGYLPEDWPVTSLDTAMVGALVILSGVALQEAGHIFKSPYDKWYKRWRRRNGDKLKDMFDMLTESQGSEMAQEYNYAKAQLSNAGRSVERVLLLEGISKMFRALAFGCLVLAGYFLVTFNWLGMGLSILFLVAAFLVFARFRFASTEEVYQAYIYAFDNEPPAI